MSRAIVLRIDPAVRLYGLTGPQSRGVIMRSFKHEASQLSELHGIKLVVRFSKTQGVWIRTGVLYQSGRYYRGMWKKNAIWFSSQSGAFVYTGTGSKMVSDGLGRIGLHEWGHGIGLGHSGDAKDIMQPNVGDRLTTSLAAFRAWMAGQESTQSFRTTCAASVFELVK